MSAQRLPNGHILAPATFTIDDPDHGQVLAEGMVDLKPGDPDYDDWDAWLST